MSLLSITSHHHELRSHNSLSIHNTKVLARNTPALPEHKLMTFPHGTRVTVRDLFGSMPVRVKQRALEVEKSGVAKELEQLIISMVALLLVFPDPVSVTIRDATSSDAITLRTKEFRNAQDKRIVPLLLTRTPSLLAQTSLYDSSEADSWVEVGARGFGVSVRGCICLVPTATKRLQFLAIGIEPLLNERHANVLYEEINKTFANSAFGVIEGDSKEDETGEKERRPSFRIKDLKARKGVDRWPTFALQICFDDRPTTQTLDVEHILDNRSATLTVIIDLLRALAYQFLKKHHFRPKPLNSTFQQAPAAEKGEKPSVSGGTPVQDRTPSPSVREQDMRHNAMKPARTSTLRSMSTVPERRSESPFDAWSRVKVGRPSNATKIIRSASQPPQTPRKPLLDGAGKLLRKPFGDIVPSTTQREPRSDCGSPQEGQAKDGDGELSTDTVVWIDPITKTKSTIDSRTGFVVESDSSIGRRISLRTTSVDIHGLSGPEPAPWIKEMLSDWQNPAYAPTEPPIPRIPDPVEAAIQPAEAGASSKCGHLKFGDASEESMLQFLGRVSRLALRDAEVIAQVDTKFILVKLALETARVATRTESNVENGDTSELLVLIDQHAADERCRVEELQEQYFVSANAELGACTSQLEKSIQFELAKQDGMLLTKFTRYFEYWGIVYTTQSESLTKSREMPQTNMEVQVHSLPPSILERCRLEPRVLIELLRKEAWKLRDEPGLAASLRSRHLDASAEGEKDWFRRFHGCPQGILDLINSRSCRSKSNPVSVFPTYSLHVPQALSCSTTISRRSSVRTLCYGSPAVSFRSSAHMDGRRWFRWWTWGVVRTLGLLWVRRDFTGVADNIEYSYLRSFCCSGPGLVL